MAKVALVKRIDDTELAVRRVVDLAEGLKIKPGMKVVIKPNICNSKNPRGMVLTDFTIIEAVVKMVRENGCEPLVVESDNIADTADNRVRDSGLMAKLEEWRVPFLNLSKDECISNEVDGTEIMIPRTMTSADYVLNLAKMKTCAHTIVTLGIKNLYGCFQEAKKSRLHKKLDSVLPFLAKKIRTDMTIVDGLTCMEGNGPVVGNPRRMDIVVAGPDVVAVDSFCIKLMGFKPEEIRHVTNTASLGVGQIIGYEVVGDPWEGFVCHFERPYSLKANIKSLGAVRDIYLKH
ncbi:MAG: DUF362 domain-containing protein [Candidatus Bathyarchaeia archaeon]